MDKIFGFKRKESARKLNRIAQNQDDAVGGRAKPIAGQSLILRPVADIAESEGGIPVLGDCEIILLADGSAVNKTRDGSNVVVEAYNLGRALEAGQNYPGIWVGHTPVIITGGGPLDFCEALCECEVYAIETGRCDDPPEYDCCGSGCQLDFAKPEDMFSGFVWTDHPLYGTFSQSGPSFIELTDLGCYMRIPTTNSSIGSVRVSLGETTPNWQLQVEDLVNGFTLINNPLNAVEYPCEGTWGLVGQSSDTGSITFGASRCTCVGDDIWQEDNRFTDFSGQTSTVFVSQNGEATWASAATGTAPLDNGGDVFVYWNGDRWTATYSGDTWTMPTPTGTGLPENGTFALEAAGGLRTATVTIRGVVTDGCLPPEPEPPFVVANRNWFSSCGCARDIVPVLKRWKGKNPTDQQINNVARTISNKNRTTPIGDIIKALREHYPA